MPAPPRLLTGEFPRTLDGRYRLALPPELADGLCGDAHQCLLAKERPGCLSLWNPADWQARLDQGAELLRGKLAAGRLAGRTADVQALGRLLSTRHRLAPIAGRGRIVIPEGFREFLAVEPGGAVMVVGAVVCVELWKPDVWAEFIGQQMPDFRRLFDELTA